MADAHKYQAHEVLNRVLNSGETALQVDIVAGAEYAEDSGHTSTDTGNFILGVRNDTLAALGGTDGDYVPFQMNADGALYVEISSSGTGSGVHVDDAAFTLGSHSGMMMMGFAGTQSVDANDAGAIAMETDGSVHIHDGGNTITVDGTVTANLSATDNTVLDNIDSNTDYGATTGGGTESGALRVTIASDSTGVVSVDDGGGALTVDGTVDLGSTATTHLSEIEGAVETIETTVGTDGSGGPAKTLSVGGTESGGNIQELRVDSDGHLQIDVLSGGGGTKYSEGAATPGTIAGLATMMERDDALGGLTPAEGDWASLRCDANGALWTHDDALDAAISGSEMQVDIVADGAGLATSANQSTIIGHVDGVETLLGTIDSDTDAIKTAVELIDNAIDGTEMQVDVVAALPAGTNTIGKVEAVGDVAENENAAGNPVLTGGRYDSSVRTLGNTDVGALALDPTGALYTREYLGQAGSILVTGTTNAVTTGVAGTKFIAIQFLEDSTFDAGAEGLVASTAGLWPDDNDASTTIDADGGAVTGSEVFPQGMTIFGRWDGFKLDSGKVIGYLGYV